MKNRKTHAIMLLLVGGFLLFTAYHLFSNMQSGSEDMSHSQFILMISLFSVTGLAILVYAFHIWYSAKQISPHPGKNDSGVNQEK